ncbi:hypothetical protein Q2T49_34415, partial [Pseudomonas aeruginosa]|uniref:hypothetical protein n=1 Tax=Pseudomonas aeruginosa TaxID=287 RepID=UPI00270AAAC5|nr:hypothetical protein [Pseudomonas aeruginosa]
YTRADSGIEVNINKAFELREKAAKLGNKKAMRSLSYTRADSGIEVNINKAFELREKAAKLGNKKAMRS